MGFTEKKLCLFLETATEMCVFFSNDEKLSRFEIISILQSQQLPHMSPLFMYLSQG